MTARLHDKDENPKRDFLLCWTFARGSDGRFLGFWAWTGQHFLHVSRKVCSGTDAQSTLQKQTCFLLWLKVRFASSSNGFLGVSVLRFSSASSGPAQAAASCKKQGSKGHQSVTCAVCAHADAVAHAQKNRVVYLAWWGCEHENLFCGAGNA